MYELTEFRKSKDQYFGKSNDSPLLTEQRNHFTGLVYFPENSGLRFEVTIDEFPEKQVTEILTSTGEPRPHLRWGSLSFAVEGQDVTLTVYRGVDGVEFFLPFADATSNKETYGSGRYLELLALDEEKFLLDFNYAYNPYCAYNPRWSCPIPSFENRLQVRMQAGEKIFPGAGSSG